MIVVLEMFECFFLLRFVAQYGRNVIKYTISIIDTTENPINKPRSPPVLAGNKENVLSIAED